MTVFIAVVHKEKDSAYGVHFPDVPGCFSAADSKEDIVRNAIEALTLHLEGEKLPKARDAFELQEEVEDDLKEGAFLLGIPFIRPLKVMKRVNVSFDAGVLQSIDHMAHERNLTRSAFLAEAAVKEIEGVH